MYVLAMPGEPRSIPSFLHKFSGVVDPPRRPMAPILHAFTSSLPNLTTLYREANNNKGCNNLGVKQSGTRYLLLHMQPPWPFQSLRDISEHPTWPGSKPACPNQVHKLETKVNLHHLWCTQYNLGANRATPSLKL